VPIAAFPNAPTDGFQQFEQTTAEKKSMTKLGQIQGIVKQKQGGMVTDNRGSLHSR
jgi:hypothetical protein